MTSFATEEYEIFDGAAKVLRTKQSGDVWQFRMWISEEGKYIRKTLKTTDLETAIDRAKKKYLETYSDVQTGRKIFGSTVDEMVNAYIDWKQQQVETGYITAGRLVTVRSQLKHFTRYKSGDLKLSELDRNSCYDYAMWRKRNKANTRDVTIRNEQATFNEMIRFACREGLIGHFDKLEFRKIKIDEKEEAKRRGIFELKEYDKLVRYMRRYCSKQECKDNNERLERLLVRDAILIASNTMLRVGELWNLKWGDILDVRDKVERDGETVQLVEIFVRAETSKVGRSRRVISRGGQYVERLRSRAKYTNADDWVFASVNGKAKISKQKWYFHWKNLMVGTGINYKQRNITWYSLRHFGITCRLRANVGHYEIAQIAGTSVSNIEKHYGHIDTSMLERAAMQSFKIDSKGELVTID